MSAPTRPKFAMAAPPEAIEDEKPRIRLSAKQMWLGLSFLAIVAGIVFIPHAWRQTSRLEAYLPDLEMMSRRSPNDGVLLALVGAREEQAQLPRAASTLARAIRTGDSNETVWLNLAAAYAENGDRAAAMDALHRGQAALPGHCSRIEAALVQAQQLGPSPDAQRLAGTINPEGPDALVAECTSGAWLDFVAEQWGSAFPEQSGFATRQQWANYEPNNAQVQRLWGEALLKNRRIAEAVDVLQGAVKLAGASPRTDASLALGLDANGQSGQGVGQCLNALQIDPRSFRATLALGECSLHAGLEYARPAFVRATVLDPTSVDAWIGLGRADYPPNDSWNKQAVEAFATVARLAPQRTDYFDNYAHFLAAVGKQQEAESLLRRRLAHHKDDNEAHYLMGGVLIGSNPTPQRLAEAAAQTEVVLQTVRRKASVDLALSPAEEQLGEIYILTERPLDAITYGNKALTDDPTSIEALRLLARAYGRVGRPALAAKMAAEAESQFDKIQRIAVLMTQQQARNFDPNYHRILAALYSSTGQMNKSTQESQMAARLTRDPTGTARSYTQLHAWLAGVLGDGS